MTLCSILESLLSDCDYTGESNVSQENALSNCFIFALLWAIGGGIELEFRLIVEEHFKVLFAKDAS